VPTVHVVDMFIQDFVLASIGAPLIDDGIGP